MRRLSLALVLLPLASAVQLDSVEVSFQAPLVAEADASAESLEWVVLFVDPSGQALATGFAEGQVDSVTTARRSTSLYHDDDSNTRVPLDEQETSSFFQEGTIQATPSAGWTSIVLEGTGLTVNASSASTIVDVRDQQKPFFDLGAREPHPTSIRWESLEDQAHGPWMRSDPLGKAQHLEVRIHASSIDSIEWHG